MRVLPTPGPEVAGATTFAIVVVVLLALGMGVLLLLNTTLAQGAFEIDRLQRENSSLQIREQTLAQQVAQAESPVSLQAKADALGMVSAGAPVFLRMSDGKVLGDATPAVGRKRSAALAPVAVSVAAQTENTGDGAVLDSSPPSDAAVLDSTVATKATGTTTAKAGVIR